MYTPTKNILYTPALPQENTIFILYFTPGYPPTWTVTYKRVLRENIWVLRERLGVEKKDWMPTEKICLPRKRRSYFWATVS